MKLTSRRRLLSSAKAGQGMNTSMQDTWNLGWKREYLPFSLDASNLSSVIDETSDPRQSVTLSLGSPNLLSSNPTLPNVKSSRKL